MGDIILNVFSLVDKRLNRLKGLRMRTKNDLDVILPQYDKINEILNNAKKLLLKDPGDINLIQQNILQIDVRLKIVETEKIIINNRLKSKDYEEEDLLFPTNTFGTTPPSSFSTFKPTLTFSTSLPTSIGSSIPSPRTTNGAPKTPRQNLLNSHKINSNNNNNDNNIELKKDSDKDNITIIEQIIDNKEEKPLEIQDLSTNNIESENLGNLENEDIVPKEIGENNNNNDSEDSVNHNSNYVDDNEKFKGNQQQTENKVEGENEVTLPGIEEDSNKVDIKIKSKNRSTIKINSQTLQNEFIKNQSPLPHDNSLEIELEKNESVNNNNNNIFDNISTLNEGDLTPTTGKNISTNTTAESLESKENNNILETSNIKNDHINTFQLSPPKSNSNNNNSNNNMISSSGPNSPSQSIPLFQNKLEIEEDKLNNTLMSSSLVDTFLLKYKGRSGSDLSISQFIQPFMMPSENNIQNPSFVSKQPTFNNSSSQLISSSLPNSQHMFMKSSQQKISEKIKLAKHTQIRKVSEAKIGHARSSSLAKINYLPTSEELQQQQQQLHQTSQSVLEFDQSNRLSVSTPIKGIQHKSLIFSNSINNSNNNNSSSSSIQTNSSQLGLSSSLDMNEIMNVGVGQGERLALLQSLLKSEELTNNAERKVIDEINTRTRLKSQELYQLVWEVRHLDKAIAHILNNRLKISDLTDFSYSDLGSANKNNNNNNNSNANNNNGNQSPPIINYYQKENGSAVIELSSSLKFSLERLVILLRTEPSILRDTLFRADYLGIELDSSFKASHTDLSQAIVFSLFGNCFTATDEKLLLLLIKSITELEFKIVKEKKSFGTHEPFSFSLLSTYLNYTYGKPYIISVLKELVVSIIQDHNINLENDPQKKAMLAQIGILEESEIDQNLLLQQFTGELLKRIIALSSGIPYALRWASKVIIQLWRDHLKESRPTDFQPSEFTIQKDKFDEREFIIHLIFENFFIPALIRPDHCGVLTGLSISHKARHNLIQIAKMLLDFIRNPATIPGWIKSYFGDMDRVLDEYFTELIQVEEPETYYHRPIFELELGQDLLVSSTDLFIILELIFHNHPDPDIQSPDETTSLQNEVVEMIKKVQPASQLQEGMKFLVINVLPKSIDNHHNASIPKLDPSVRLAKENLILALSVLSFLCGYSSSNNICELLLLQCGRSRSLELNILEAQIEETIRSLWALPEVYKQNDYQLLLDSMFDDYYRREKKRSLEKQLKVLYLDQLQRHTSQINSQRNINIEFLTNQKFRLFRDKIYARMQTEFVSSFMSQFTQHTGPCDCEPTLEVSNICKICTQKSNSIQSFIQKSKTTLQQSEWWRSASEDDLNFASNTLERNLLTQIYNFTFNVSKHDLLFQKELNSKFSSIDYTQLYIPEKYSNQAPWELAQQELKKINLYKSPHDKMKCIIDTWNIIFNYTKPLGESGPDDFLPIMGFVIIKSRPENILSNIQYIQLYTQLNDDDEIWFMNLKSSIEIVREVLKDLKSSGWRKGILSLTSQRMENMLKEIKRKEKLKKWRTSIVRLESNSPVLQQLQQSSNQPSIINNQL